MRAAVLLLAACAPAPPDWSARPLAETRDTVDGIALAIRLPAGLTRGDAGEWHAGADDPSVLVTRAEPPVDLAAFEQAAHLDPRDTVSDRRTIPGGFALAHRAGNDVELAVEVARGGLWCHAGQAHRGGVPNPAATLRWLAEICGFAEVDNFCHLRRARASRHYSRGDAHRCSRPVRRLWRRQPSR